MLTKKRSVSVTPSVSASLAANNRRSIAAFVRHIQLVRGLDSKTISAYQTDLVQLAVWSQTNNMHDIRLLQPGQLEAFFAFVSEIGISTSTLTRKQSAIKQFFNYLYISNEVDCNPCQQLAKVQREKKLPHTLSPHLVDTLLAAPDTNNATGIRDKAMLELMYASGLRVSELVNLPIHAINFRQGIVRVIGKRGKERLIPFGQSCHTWLIRYLQTARPQCQSEAVFLTARGVPMRRETFWHRIKHWCQIAGLDSRISPHMLRHAFATHLLDNGANLRSVQLLLGHSSLSTTQIYTYIAQARLKQLFDTHHPRK